MDKEKRVDEGGKFSKEYYSGNFKQILIYVNDTQKRGLVEFFERKSFYGYAIVPNLESVWSKTIKHRDTHAWPGSDCLFMISVREESVDGFLKNLKDYRMTLAENTVFAIAITPIERLIPDLYSFEI